MEITQKIIEAVKARYQLARRWQGRPGLLGFGLLGLGTLISGLRDDVGMGILLIAVMIAFVGEQVRLYHLSKGGRP